MIRRLSITGSVCFLLLLCRLFTPVDRVSVSPINSKYEEVIQAFIQTPIPNQITTGAKEAAGLSPIGGGSKIAFSSNRSGNFEIYVMNPDGTNITQLTHTPQFDEYVPYLSPDGSYVLFWSVPTGITANTPITPGTYWMKIDGSEHGNLANGFGPNEDISSLGSITFEIYTKGSNRDIYVMPAVGGEEVQLTTDPADDYYPDWSPDGKMIAFNSNRDGTLHIYLMNADGSNQHRLIRGDKPDFMPAWSPDGSMIAFTLGNDTEANIFIINSDGSNLRQLTQDGRSLNVEPEWSPDGSTIAFWSKQTGNRDIYIINVDGSGLKNLTLSPGDDEDPTWSK